MIINDLMAWFELSILENMDWRAYVVLSLVVYGVYHALFDIITNRPEISKQEHLYISYVTIGWASGVIAVVCGTWLAFRWGFEPTYLRKLEYPALFGIVQGLLFFVLMLSRVEARKRYDSHVVHATTKMSIVLVIVFSWILFREFQTLSIGRWIGFFLLALSLMLLLERRPSAGVVTKTEEESVSDRRDATSMVSREALFLVVALIFSALISLLAKYAVSPLAVDLAHYIFFSNLCTAIAAAVAAGLVARRSECGSVLRGGKGIRFMTGGTMLGLVNLLAYYWFLKALKLADASVVIPIHSLYIVIPIVVVIVHERQRMTWRKTMGIVASVAAIWALAS